MVRKACGESIVLLLLLTPLGAQNQPTQIIDGDIQRGHQFVTTEAVVLHSDVLNGKTTYRLLLHKQRDDVQSVYVLYGDSDSAMRMLPAYQAPAPFGTNIGGTNPAFIHAMPVSAYDSWLTVGLAEGNVHNDIASVGIHWDSWNMTNALVVEDGAVFWTDPNGGPAFLEGETDTIEDGIMHRKGVVVGQVTIDGLEFANFPASVSAQGRTVGSEPDWQQLGLRFTFASSTSTRESPSPAPPPAPTGDGGDDALTGIRPEPCSDLQSAIVERCVFS